MSSIEKVNKQRSVIVNIKDCSGVNDISDYKCYYVYLNQIGKVFPLSGREVIVMMSLDTGYSNPLVLDRQLQTKQINCQ